MAKGAPKGNTYAKGNKGGGRPSAYLERLDAEWHELIWKQMQDVEGLEKKIQTKKYAGRDMAALRLLKGDKYIIGKFMDKLVPDLHEVSGPGGSPLFLPSDILVKHNLHDPVDPPRDAKTSSE